MTRARLATASSIVLVALLFAYLAWKRRWISDDGLIYVRIVHQILDGHGPVYNAFERAEANTSALWPWIVALFGLITRAPIAQLSVGLGLLFSVAGLAIAMDGTRRWHRARGDTGVLVPFGAILPLALFPFWDYATSGLETGLTTLWLGGAWWLLVTVSASRRHVMTAVVLGLGPLVRPDLGLVTIVFLIAAWLIIRPTRRRTLALAAAALALPCAFEVFRAGYYGTLVPLPAIAKSASHSAWDRGWLYLRDFVDPTWIWVPALVAIAMIIVGVRRGSIAARDRVGLLAPVIAALLLALYVLRVGGDFMHARMWLPATFIALLPGLLVPWRRWTAGFVIAVAVWGIAIEHVQAQTKVRRTSFYVEDERIGYAWWTKQRFPISETAYIDASPEVRDLVHTALRDGRPAIVTEGGARFERSADSRARFVFFAGRLGTGGVLTPTDGIVADTLGLANPIGARITVTNPEQSAGHQKSLPFEWLFADFGDAAHDEDASVDPAAIRAARHAMQCGDLAELLASVREPMTAGRFFSNLAGAIHRTRIVIPADPFDAEQKFCGTTWHPHVTVSSSCEQWGWAKDHAVDGRLRSHDALLGYSSQVWIKQDHPEWIALEFPQRQVTGIVLYPRTDPDRVGMGFPIDFSIQTWDGTAWVDRVTRTAFPRPDAAQSFSFTPVTTSRVRIFATKLQNVPADDYVMQFAEISVL